MTNTITFRFKSLPSSLPLRNTIKKITLSKWQQAHIRAHTHTLMHTVKLKKTSLMMLQQLLFFHINEYGALFNKVSLTTISNKIRFYCKCCYCKWNLMQLLKHLFCVTNHKKYNKLYLIATVNIFFFLNIFTKNVFLLLMITSLDVLELYNFITRIC